MESRTAFGDWLWLVLVLQLASLLNRLTLQQAGNRLKYTGRAANIPQRQPMTPSGPARNQKAPMVVRP
jgi:hypothetical protein